MDILMITIFKIKLLIWYIFYNPNFSYFQTEWCTKNGIISLNNIWKEKATHGFISPF